MPQENTFQRRISEADRYIDILTLCNGTRIDGTPYYAYLLVPPSKYQALVEKAEVGDFELAEYGEVIVSGNRAAPNPAVKKKIEEYYNLSPNFAEQVKQTLQKMADDLDALETESSGQQ